MRIVKEECLEPTKYGTIDKQTRDVIKADATISRCIYLGESGCTLNGCIKNFGRVQQA